MVHQLPAFVTMLNVFLLFTVSLCVGKARAKYGIKVPATTGNVDFERVFRAQMNTVESTMVFLPSLWLFANYISPLYAGVIGLVWIVARIFFVINYIRAASARAIPFGISFVCSFTLAVGALIGILKIILMG